MTLTTAEPGPRGCLTDQEWQQSNTTTTLPSWATLTADDAAWGESRSREQGETIKINIGKDPRPWVEPTVQSLKKLLDLPPDWDSYGGSPIDPTCVYAALILVSGILPDNAPAPSVVPTSRGGLQLEWHTRGVDLEVEFLSSTRVCGLFEDVIAGTSWEKDLSFDLRPLVDAISTLSQRR